MPRPAAAAATAPRTARAKPQPASAAGTKRRAGEERAGEGRGGQGHAGEVRGLRAGGTPSWRRPAQEQQEAQSGADRTSSRRHESDQAAASTCRPSRERAITMEWVETTGRTIAEALDAALDELGVDEEDVEYEVLEQPKSGFLGAAREQRGPDPGSGEADLAREAGGAPAPQPAGARRVPAAVATVGSGGTVVATAGGGREARRQPAYGGANGGGNGGGGGFVEPAPAGRPRRQAAGDGSARERQRAGSIRRIRRERRAAGEQRGHHRERRADRGAGGRGRALHPGSGRRLRPRCPGRRA